ncbi:type II toxin-antitoxin system VapC family toxin [Candidatus Woesearchaeota archaeon]|nr:type II toxin-antitoxin system VapC family toxin [Candidatus Woesearchaeota archaeon]
MIADTSFLIDLLNNESGAVQKAHQLDNQNVPLFTTAVSVFELWQGVSEIKNKEKLEKINTLLESIGFFHLDKECAKIGGRIHSELCSKGMAIQPEDSMIAGICVKHSRKILTRNVKHFSRVKLLEVETY